jgi:hypothetical protein
LPLHAMNSFISASRFFGARHLSAEANADCNSSA